MVNQLNSLISGTVRRPIIINGKLVKSGKQVLLVRRDNYKVVFLVAEAANRETVVEEGNDLLKQAVKDFNTKYGAICQNNREMMEQLSASVDSFTGAVVLKSGLYNMLLDKTDTMHLHDGKAQFQTEVQNLVTEFELEFTVNYFEIYCSLLNRRVMSSHIPMKIKSHLVAGLYQPLVVQTRCIDSPVRMSRFDWFFHYINSPTQHEELLESVNETSRGLELSVISMSDLKLKFGTPLVRELDRVHFTYTLLMTLMGSIKSDGSVALAVNNLNLYNALREGRAGVAGTTEFLHAFVQGVTKSRQGLAVRG